MDFLVIKVNGADQKVPVRLSEKIGNAASALGRATKAAIKGDRLIASPAEMDRRLEICSACEFYQDGGCLKCGCFIAFKTRLETEHCPIGKW